MPPPQQTSLIYSFVARSKTVLAEYTAFSGNFSTVAVQCLEKLPPNNNKFTYTCDGHTFNYLVEDGFSKIFGTLVVCVSLLKFSRLF
jgi:vesicle-associated membrane protein 72